MTRPIDRVCIVVLTWHSERMAGKEIDPLRAKSALAVIKQNPGIVLFAASPLLALVAVTWYFAGAFWGIALALVLLVAGGALILRKR
jgi:hypothetical protein